MAEKLDRRLHAFRPDLADEKLKGRVDAARFIEGVPARVTAPVANLHAGPDKDAAVDTQLLFGEDVEVFDQAEGWAWVQSTVDGYVGYVPDEQIGQREADATHLVAVPRSFVYPEAELKKPQLAAHSMGARLRVDGEEEKRGTLYAVLSDGSAMIARHLVPVGLFAQDYVSVAETFLHTPYLWGGRSGFGIDCSGLVQLSLQMAGRNCPRDADMQEQGLGDPVSRTELQRGDLVFWKGHVAIMMDETTIIHANGNTMSVAIEPLEQAIARVERLYGQPTSYRRP